MQAGFSQAQSGLGTTARIILLNRNANWPSWGWGYHRRAANGRIFMQWDKGLCRSTAGKRGDTDFKTLAGSCRVKRCRASSSAPYLTSGRISGLPSGTNRNTLPNWHSYINEWGIRPFKLGPSPSLHEMGSTGKGSSTVVRVQ